MRQEAEKMYHIPNDKRAITSAEGLYNGLLECAKKRAITEITITDITSSSGVSRATFYRLFDNSTDILLYKCNLIMGEALKQASILAKEDLEKTFIHYISSWMKNKELLIALIENNRMDILASSHEKHMKEIEELLLKNRGLTEFQEHYLASLLVGIMPSVFKIWLMNQKQSPEEVLKEVKNGLMLMNELFTQKPVKTQVDFAKAQ